MRIVDARQYTPTTKWIYAEGVSTETKPTTGLVTGSIFYELDTGRRLKFEAETGKWYSGNEGGGESFEKGMVSVLKSLNFSLWAEKEKHIPPKDVNFYDYDGTVLYAYSAQEFLALSDFPALPAHAGLTAQGWNWELATAKTYVENYGVCEIGASYITEDGKTRAVIEIGAPEGLTVSLKFQQSAANAVSIDWGDGSEAETTTGTTAAATSHTYAAAGRYVIALTVADGATMKIGNNGAYQGGFIGQGNNWTGRSVLKALYIGAQVPEISTQGLWCQTNLKEITIPEGVTVLGSRSIETCIKLKACVIPRGVTVLADFLFRCDYSLEVLCIPDTVVTFNSVCQTCVNLARVTIPEGVSAIGGGAFIRCFSAEIINLPDSIYSLGASAFESCYSLLEIRVSEHVTAIPAKFARQCHNLRKCELHSGITSIGAQAFSGNFGLGEFEIPDTVTSIGDFAFLYNDGTIVFHVRPTTPPVIEPTAFTATNVTMTFLVPYSADHSVLNAYLAATGWASKGDQIQEEEAPAV